jgi:nucleoid DNA-binding protein
MTHNEVVQALAERMDLSQRKAHHLLQTTIKELSNVLINNGALTIPDLGTFGSHIRKQHKAYNPANRRLVMLPTKRAVHFHPGILLKSDLHDVEVTG